MDKTLTNISSIIILASASSRRLELLRQIRVIPDVVCPANINEAKKPSESPKNLAFRLSQEKAQAIFEPEKGHFVLAADTVVSCGQKVLDKPENAKMARNHLKMLSGRRHRVYGGISLITPEGKLLTRECMTMVQFKPLTEKDIDDYIQSGEWEGKAGSYAIQGLAGGFVKHMAGSYSNVVGLSLYDTMKIFESGGLTPDILSQKYQNSMKRA